MSDECIQVRTETVKTYANLTVEQVAEAFMSMDDGQMAEFFGHCYDIEERWRQRADEDGRFYIHGGQWLWTRDELAKNKHARTGNGWAWVVGFSAFFWNHFEEGWLGR